MASARCEQVLERLRALGNPANVQGMARFGINPQNTLGVSMPALRKLARELKRDHELAQELWASGIHEARILAGLVDDPRQVTVEQMERWAAEFDSWDMCDQVCMNLFDKTPLAYGKAAEWAERREEFVRRAGFALMASLAWHDKKASDDAFTPFLPLIVRASTDERNFVKKAVNWALRQIGKRNANLRSLALQTARDVQNLDSRSARWIASDAIRELERQAAKERPGASV